MEFMKQTIKDLKELLVLTVMAMPIIALIVLLRGYR